MSRISATFEMHSEESHKDRGKGLLMNKVFVVIRVIDLNGGVGGQLQQVLAVFAKLESAQSFYVKQESRTTLPEVSRVLDCRIHHVIREEVVQ